MDKIVLQPFDLNDWMAFAGAEGEPLVAYTDITLDGHFQVDAAIVVDNTGLSIFTLEGNTLHYATDARTAKFMAEETLKWDGLTMDGLVAMGFEVL